MKIARVKIEIEYEFPDSCRDEDIIIEVSNKELPKGYKEDSWEFIKIYDSKKNLVSIHGGDGDPTFICEEGN